MKTCSFDFDFLIDGQPIYGPDGGVTISYEDLDSSESGRDEAGVMHRIVLREQVKKIPLTYTFLTCDEYQYMEALFAGKPEFCVECRDKDGSPVKFTAYRSKHSITFLDVSAGGYRNYNFNIVEC